MLKNILKLKDAQQLNKNEQKSINGGGNPPEMCYCVNLGNTVQCDKYDMICPLDY